MNKKGILSGIAALSITALAVFNVSLNTQSKNLSSLASANIEALAQNENGGGEGGSETGCSCQKTCSDGSTILTCHGTQCNCCVGYYYVICDNIKSTCGGS
jgi:hypothetical protein